MAIVAMLTGLIIMVGVVFGSANTAYAATLTPADERYHVAFPYNDMEYYVGVAGLDASGNAKSEMAACNSGKTQQDRAACRKEVHNANAEKRAGQLGNGADYTANALKRCEVFKKSEDQAACRARIESQARIDGSVAGGGVLRETETVVPAQ